jgi:hypothetical protein
LQDKEAVFKEWQTSDEQRESQTFDEQCWKTRVINCLNFIVDDGELSKKFKSLEEASLMLLVHQELKSAIDQL